MKQNFPRLFKFIFNTIFRQYVNYPNSIEGIATVVNASIPNQLDIKWNRSSGGGGIYNLLDTDYSNYALVYSCKEYDWGVFTVRNEFAYVLSRYRTIKSQEVFDSWKEKLTPYADISKLQMTDQENC